MTIYWMLNNHWPSFFGNIFDYYLRPGGAYYGAKKGLRPLSAVFDSYATGDHSQANVTAVNQTPHDATDLRVRVRVYDLQGRVRDDRTSQPLTVPSGGAAPAMTLPRMARDSRVFFVRCELLGSRGERALRERLLAVATQRRRRRSRRRLRLPVEPGELGRHDRAQLHDPRSPRRHRDAQHQRRRAEHRRTSGCTTPPNRSPSSNGRRSPRTATVTRSCPSSTPTTT